MFQVDARVLPEFALLRGFAFFASSTFFPVNVRAIHAAEIAEGCHRRAGFEQEVVAGDPEITRNAEVAICHPTEQESVVFGEGKGFRDAVRVEDLEVDGGRGVNAELLK